MAAPKIAAILAREALNNFGDQLPTGVKEAISFVDSPKNAILNLIRNEAKERIRDVVMGDPHKLIENSFPSSGGSGGKPRFDEEGMSVEAFKRGGKVKTKPVAKTKINTASRRGDGIAQRGKTRGRYL